MANEAFADRFRDSFSFGRKGVSDRTFARVAVSFPVRFSVVSEFEYEALRPVFMASPTRERYDAGAGEPQSASKEVPGSMASAIIDRLSAIEKKLDQLLGVTSSEEEGSGLAVETGHTRDISGAGIRLGTRVALGVGWGLNIMVKTIEPFPLDVTVLGRVVRILPHAEGSIYESACKFVVVNEEDREEINSFVFKRQRELARIRQLNQ